MKIYLDTADIDQIRRANDTGLLDGVTTNPTLISKAGKTFESLIQEICALVNGPVSAEAMGETVEDFVAQGSLLAKLAPNVVIKIPMTVEGLKAVPVLEKEKNIRTNVTMIFSATQAFLAMKAGATMVSIVLSRLDAVANESELLVKAAVEIKKNYGFTAQILSGSLKTQNHMLESLRAGVDIATIPEALFFQMFKHPLTDLGLATFQKDWQTANVS